MCGATMNLLFSFAPFFAFAVLIHLGYVEAALWAGVLVAGALLLRDRLLLRHSFKILEVGTLVLFAALALYTERLDRSGQFRLCASSWTQVCS